MNFSKLLKNELLKIRRSKIIPLLFIAPILVVVSGIANISQYFTPEYTNAWGAMFIQSALVYAYYLLPFSMIVFCTMLSAQETQNRGLVKMLTLPVSRSALSLSKFCLLVFVLLAEIIIFFLVFVVAGLAATQMMGVPGGIPVFQISLWCGGLFLTMLPCIGVIWLLTVLFSKPIWSIGLNLLLTIPAILAANTSFWIVYPYCYSGYFVSLLLNAFSTGATTSALQWFPFLPIALLIFLLALQLSSGCFGKVRM